MPTTDFGGYYYPSGDQDAVVAADLMHLADDLDQNTVLKAQDAADRDARYSDVAAGTIVVALDGTQWVKVSTPPDAPKWLTGYSDTGKLTTGVATANSLQPVVINQQAGRIRNSVVSLYVSFTWNGDPWTLNSSGDMANTRLGAALGRFVPPYTQLIQWGIDGWNGSGYISSADGGIWMKNGVPGGTIITGATIAISATYHEDA